LAHCLNICGAQHVIVDTETARVFGAARPLLERPLQQWVVGPAHGDQRDLSQALKSCSQLAPDRGFRTDMTARETALLTFTSATHFWDDLVAEGCTMFVYIGELCRYLVNQPPTDAETRHKIRLAFGNGLRPDIWPVMKQRFRIPEILEFYGSTEGNVSMFNFD